MREEEGGWLGEGAGAGVGLVYDALYQCHGAVSVNDARLSKKGRYMQNN